MLGKDFAKSRKWIMKVGSLKGKAGVLRCFCWVVEPLSRVELVASWPAAEYDATSGRDFSEPAAVETRFAINSPF